MIGLGWVKIGSTGLKWVFEGYALGYNGLNWVSLGYTGLHRVIRGLAEFDWVRLG